MDRQEELNLKMAEIEDHTENIGDAIGALEIMAAGFAHEGNEYGAGALRTVAGKLDNERSAIMNILFPDK